MRCFCSGTVALNRLVGQPTYPGIVDDYRATYATGLSDDFDKALAKQTAALQAAK